jgi:sodium/pantothenate symporter
MPVLLIRFYVIPYQTAAGRLLTDGSIDWWTGEALLALSTAVLYIPLGLISAAVIRRRYS